MYPMKFVWLNKDLEVTSTLQVSRRSCRSPRHLGTGALRGAQAAGVRCHVAAGRNSTSPSRQGRRLHQEWKMEDVQHFFKTGISRLHVPCSIPCSMHKPACTGFNGSKVRPGATTNWWTGGLRRHHHWHPQQEIQHNLGLFDVGVSNQRCVQALGWHWPSIPSWLTRKSIDFHQCPVLPTIPKSENTHVWHPHTLTYILK